MQKPYSSAFLIAPGSRHIQRRRLDLWLLIMGKEMQEGGSFIVFSRLFACIRQLPHAEFNVLAALFVAAAALFGFGALVDAVGEGETRKFDTAVLLAFRNPANHGEPIGPAWLKVVVRDLTSLGSTPVLAFITVAVIGYLLIDGKRHAAVLVLAATAGGAALSSLLKLGFERPRPELVSRLVDATSFSFPSGHAMLSAVTYLTLGALLARVHARRRLKAYLLGVALTLTILVGISRVYLGVHWPTDVLAGWCAGAAWAMLCWIVAAWLQARGEVERENGQ